MISPNEAPFDPAQVQFLYVWIEDSAREGAATFFNIGRIPGGLALENEVVRWNQAFELPFGGGYVARTPGLVDSQTIRVQLQGHTFDYAWDHTLELAASVYGPSAPIVEMETPTGEILLFSYRAKAIGESSWCRVVPMLSDSPAPFGFMSRHTDRVIALFLHAFFLTFFFLLFMCAPIAIALKWWANK